MSRKLPILCKELTAILLLLLSFNCHAQTQKTEILWDNYGVPHVYGKDEASMYYAFGWAQMQSHANLLLQLYGKARGRAAEYWGEKYIASDRQVHLFNIPEVGKQHYAKQDREEKSYLDAFVNGLNSYAAAHPEAIDDANKPVLPVTVPDVLAHSTRIICLEFLADFRNPRRTAVPGSNAVAIAPSRSASKNAMLLSNPHLPWSDFFLFFEAELSAPGFHAYGASLVGQPVLNIAFNDNLGWTHTVNTIDASDMYELVLKDGGYELDGQVRHFEKRRITLQVRQTNGGVKSQELELLSSLHGAVISERDGSAIAIRIAGLENAWLAKQYHKMAKAKNWKEFEAAIKMMQNPMFNIIYADKAGNILYLFNGNVPKRPEGDWAFWKSVIDGRSSKYIWTQYHSYDELPRVFNPATGFVQNANDPPWTSTYPVLLDPKAFPPYISPQQMPLRPQRAVNMIKNDHSITFQDLIDCKLNTGVEAADRFLDDLLAAVQRYPDTAAQAAASVLKKWDRKTDGDSRGATLFFRWFDLLGPEMATKKWVPEQPVSTPDGLSDGKKAVDLLVKAATEVRNTYGSLDVAWGDVNRFVVGNYNLPGNGGGDRYGIYRTMAFAKTPLAKENVAVNGDTYVAVTEFGKKVRAQVLLSYGNASQKGSKHIGDQLPLLSEKKLRPALLDKADVLKNLEKREEIKITY